MEPFQIVPSVGVGPLRLGMSHDEVRRCIGEPDLVEDDIEPPDTNSQSWEYTVAGLELRFSSDFDWCLEWINVRRTTATLNGHQLIGLSETGLRALALAGELGRLDLDFAFPARGVESLVAFLSVRSGMQRAQHPYGQQVPNITLHWTRGKAPRASERAAFGGGFQSSMWGTAPTSDILRGSPELTHFRLSKSTHLDKPVDT